MSPLEKSEAQFVPRALLYQWVNAFFNDLFLRKAIQAKTLFYYHEIHHIQVVYTRHLNNLTSLKLYSCNEYPTWCMELDHSYFMGKAYQEAKKAAEEDEVPIGAVVALGNEIIGKGYNQTRKLNDNTAHAEILAITAASNKMGAGILEDCRLYVTIEPCAMCAGAIKWARPSHLFIGAREPKFGFTQFEPSILHPSTKVEFGLMKDECADLMKAFFKVRRMNKM